MLSDADPLSMSSTLLGYVWRTSSKVFIINCFL